MEYLSTGGGGKLTRLAEALRRGLAEGGGLYLPRHIDPLPETFFARLPGMAPLEAAQAAAERLLGNALPEAERRRIVAETLDFPLPLVRLSDQVRILELFHGPTLAFKDVGARFLARLLAATDSGDGLLTVLVATSGDTGGAVARAFFGVAGTRVAILYPHGQVSPLQERQLTTLGGNVRAFAARGTFDDCQRLVKGAFADDALRRELCLTSANSINIGRLLPQSFYYLMAVASLSAAEAARPRIFVTPSGNFGNLTAGLIAYRLGLPARRFVAATNVNDVVPEYLETGVFTPRASQRTLSNAMDVGDPSNFARILHLYGHDLAALRRDVRGRRYDDQATGQAIVEVDQREGYLLDPHTAVGYLAARDELTGEPPETLAIVLATAHPAKFADSVEPLVGRKVPLPPALAETLDAEVVKEELPIDGGELARRLRDWKPA